MIAFFKAIQAITRQHGVDFWGNAEIWRKPVKPYTPMAQTNRTWAGAERVAEQLRQASPYVDGFVIWEWYQYLSPAGAHAYASFDDGLCAPTNSSLTHFHDYGRVVLRDEPRLDLRSFGIRPALDPPPLSASPAGPPRLTDGDVFKPLLESAKWVLGPTEQVPSGDHPRPPRPETGPICSAAPPSPPGSHHCRSRGAQLSEQLPHLLAL